MEQRLSLVTLGVGDLARARRFYEKGLGWTPLDGPEGVVFFQLPGMVFALWPRADLAADAGLATHGPETDAPASPGAPSPTPAGFGGLALAYNTRSREEVDAVLAEAEAGGATVTKPGAETFWGGYSGYFRDPDGHLWEVAWNPFWRIDETGGVWAAP